jgi:hypothetical protein
MKTRIRKMWGHKHHDICDTVTHEKVLVLRLHVFAASGFRPYVILKELGTAGPKRRAQAGLRLQCAQIAGFWGLNFMGNGHQRTMN